MPTAAYEVASVRKALEILCGFSSRTPILSVSDISRRLGIPKSTAHNLLRTLHSFDFIAQDRETKTYRLGPRLYELGMQFSETMQLAAIALPHLRRLVEATRETAKLAVLSDGEALIVAAVESPYQLHTRGDSGRRAALHCTGLGKALLSCLTDREVREIAARRGLPAYTRHTITSLARLERELGRVRACGYAFDSEENEEGVRCLAAPVSGAPASGVCALSVSGPAGRIADDRLVAVAAQVREAARELGLALQNSRLIRNSA